MVEDPADYAWSSHRVYLGVVECDWLITDMVLAAFGSRVAFGASVNFLNILAVTGLGAEVNLIVYGAEIRPTCCISDSRDRLGSLVGSLRCGSGPRS